MGGANRIKHAYNAFLNRERPSEVSPYSNAYVAYKANKEKF